MNFDYEPSEDDEIVLGVMKHEWCGRVTPYLIREETELDKQRINGSLDRLTAAGWVEKRSRGLYDFVDDPRND